MAEHTQGPWAVSTDGDEPEVIAELCTSGLAHFLIVPTGETSLGDIERDARLIASAPMMLEALQMAFDRDLTYLSDHAAIPRQDVVRARLAIRAALGDAPNPHIHAPKVACNSAVSKILELLEPKK